MILDSQGRKKVHLEIPALDPDLLSVVEESAGQLLLPCAVTQLVRNMKRVTERIERLESRENADGGRVEALSEMLQRESER